MLAADFDGDQQIDRALIDLTTQSWFIITARGSMGTTQIPWGWRWGGTDPSHQYQVLAADFDGDRQADLVLVDLTTQSWFIYTARSGPTGTSQIPWGWRWNGTNPSHSYQVLAADFDGDGHMDQALVDLTTQAWFVLTAKGATGTEKIPWGSSTNLTSGRSYFAAAADFDGDRKADQIMVDMSAANHTWYSFGSVTAPQPPPTPTPTPQPNPNPGPGPSPTPPKAQWTITSAPALRIDCNVRGVCNEELGQANGNYAYAPSDIVYNGARHLFMCATGTMNVNQDRIRYINDRDAQLKVLLNPAGFPSANGADLAACDPSVVFFQGYFYLFYGSTRAINPSNPDRNTTNLINVIHVARSASISGPYQILDQDGSWKNTTQNPKHIIGPKVLSAERHQSAGYLGASWPSVIVQSNRLIMFYMDDTPDSTGRAPLSPYFMITSSNPAEWNTAQAQRTDLSTTHSGEVKYDPRTNSYVIFSVRDAHSAKTWIGYQTSTDGIHWSAVQKSGDAPAYSHNLGVESDEKGYLLNRPNVLASFGAPIGLVNDPSWSKWNLFTVTLTRQ